MRQIKKLALCATVALGAMSCSNNEIIETLNEQNEICFASVQMGNGIITRANETLTGNETFGVYAYKTSETETTWFENEKLSKSGIAWGLPSKFYYPTGNFSMSFWAYGKTHAVNKPTSVSAAGLVYNDYNIFTTTTDNLEGFVISKDVVTVTNTTKNNPVALNFWHALCKIKFTAKIANDANFANVDAKITGITINTSKTGSISYEGPTSKWVPSATIEGLTITLTAAAATDALTTAPTAVTNSFYAIPLATGGTNTITVDAVLYHKNTTIEVGSISGTIEATAAQMAINNSVTYNIILDLDQATGLTEIKFAEPTIEDWTPIVGGDITFPPTTQP